MTFDGQSMRASADQSAPIPQNSVELVCACVLEVCLSARAGVVVALCRGVVVRSCELCVFLEVGVTSFVTSESE